MDTLTTSEERKSLKTPSAPLDERYFLEGPRSRMQELFFTFRVLKEFIRGFRVLHFVGPCVAVFGSARVKSDSQYYDEAMEMGRGIASLGFTVMTGGGPGVMEAASKGARQAGGRTVGCNIILPKEQQPNKWLNVEYACRYFFVRKVLMFKYSYGFVIMPGGIGTVDEFFEALTLIQTGKIINFPIVLMNKGYWAPVTELLHNMLAENMIDAADLKYILVTDSTKEAIAHLREYAISQYRRKRKMVFRKFKWLGE
ncbi:TIGR00730 family Rossman fold protein [Chitinophaga sedimenti]|uniref:LOG family protein n=1 Tax=Chitinophaga sedimenti TaxID=2033606 RepID=UPI00200573E4|nr:TIGR00730 family Rossman fold protein [Chitinophaga sedimenti]MCK7557161.1 TIGR00730 family Rossman fold protein [Chitinophaga sedimenti]